MTSRTSESAQGLLSAAAVRERSHELLAVGVAGGLAEWRVDLSRLDECAAFTAAVIRDQYPALDVPFHARWRHFTLGGQDLWQAEFPDAASRARAEFDLAITSVLLDAGSGPGWRYHDTATGLEASRSEGLGIASLRLFQAGSMSGYAITPLRADAETLAALSADTLAEAFQVTPRNPLLGLDGRAALLRALGRRALARPDLFALADTPRPGGLYDAMAARASGGRLPAPVILEVLLEALGAIWPGRLTLDGVPLGDCWPHPAIRRDGPTNGLLPLHKLSQWLSYSLIEPLQRAGLDVVDIDGLTGLAEYRNGGLFLDLGVIAFRDPEDAHRAHEVSSPLVVGWRGLTVALLDEIAPLVRTKLGVTAEAFPLARILEGGTWAAGRKAAKALRADGGPPFKVISDGTVF